MATDTRSRILDATLAVMGRDGLARLAVEDVAREAGVSRQTIYRHVASRDGLITATILREEEAFLTRMRAAAERHDDLRVALRAAIEAALRSAREHPLLDRLLAREPEALLPFLVDGTGPVLSAAQTVVTELFGRYVPQRPADEQRHAAEAATRLIISYTIAPSTRPVGELADDLASLLVDGIAPRHLAAARRV